MLNNRFKFFSFILLVVALITLGAACRKVVPVANNTNQPTVKNSIQIGEGSGTLVKLPEVILENPGFIVINEVKNDQAGAIVGISPLLPTGKSQNVEIVTAELTPNAQYLAILRQDNKDGYFLAADDLPVRENDKVVAVLFTATEVKLANQPNDSLASTTPQLRVFTVNARRFAFEPAVIAVNRGDQVKITVTSVDVKHSFYLPDYNINKALEPNVPVVVEFTANKVGEFPFFCAVYCGAGQTSMKGKLIVK
ncbi:MAG: cupredoxin domain-containing protein [Candidatus Buchananbacteria bacterium]